MSHTGVGISDVTFLSFFFLSRSKSKNNRPFWPTLPVKTFVHRFIFIPTCISRSEVFLNWKLAGWCVWRQLGCLLWGLCWNNISSFELFHIMRRSEFVYLKLGKKPIILLLYYAYASGNMQKINPWKSIFMRSCCSPEKWCSLFSSWSEKLRKPPFFSFHTSHAIPCSK